MVMRAISYVVVMVCCGLQMWGSASADELDTLRARVPEKALAAARSLKNPLPPTPAMIAKGRALYHGKGFCVACHGIEGRGLADVDATLLKGVLPTDFTNARWQAARTDGELRWILQNGSVGTAMASFVPSVLTEEEAWQVIHYIRSLGRQR